MPRYPARVDLRPQFAKWGLALKPQGARPTCSVFVITAALEFAAAQRHQDGFIFSEEYLNWASNEVLDQYEDGGFFSDLWQGYQKHGICEARLAEYRDIFDPAWRPSKEAVRQAHSFRLDAYELTWIKSWDVTTGLCDDELAAVLDSLRAGLPVCLGMRWPKQPEYDEGVLRMCPPEEVFDGHSVLLVGYVLEHVGDLTSGVVLARDSGSGGRYVSLPISFICEYTNDAAVVSD